MKIYPAIDLRQGKCVRLYRGDFNLETHYSDDPIAVCKNFIKEGAKWLHLIDLDAAKDPQICQFSLIKELLQKVSLNVQIGGGIRNEEQVKKYLEWGAKRLIIGSLAVKNPDLIKKWIEQFGNNVFVFAMDVKYINREPMVTTQAWQEISSIKLFDLLEYYQTFGIRHILCTDIDRDGTLLGPNIELYQQLTTKFLDLQFQASGGISQLTDLQELKKINLSATVVGKALYEKRFSLREAYDVS